MGIFFTQFERRAHLFKQSDQELFRSQILRSSTIIQSARIKQTFLPTEQRKLITFIFEQLLFANSKKNEIDLFHNI